MKSLTVLLTILLVSLVSMTSCEKEDVSPFASEKYISFNRDMRVLWSDHALWTRNVIINVLDGTPGTDEAVNRLLKNQEDIGNALKPYYGNDAGDALTTLLKAHISGAAVLLTAAKEGNTSGFETAQADWYRNGDEIAAFLNTANPEHWALDHWKQMMKTHLDLTLEEAAARLNQDYAADVIAYDKVYAELMTMADMLAEGVAAQFPEKF
jgi:hypothetical protein